MKHESVSGKVKKAIPRKIRKEDRTMKNNENKRRFRPSVVFPVVLSLVLVAVFGFGIALSDKVPSGSGVISLEEVETPMAGEANYKVALAGGKSTTVTGAYNTSVESQLISQINEYRRSKGLNTLKVNTALNKSADTRSTEASYKFSHTRPNGKAWSTVSTVTKGENLSSASTTATSIMNAWKRSSSHNANLLRSNYKTVGVSVFCKKMTTKLGKSYYVTYAALEFGR